MGRGLHAGLELDLSSTVRAALRVGEDRIVTLFALHHRSALHFKRELERQAYLGEKNQDHLEICDYMQRKSIVHQNLQN